MTVQLITTREFGIDAYLIFFVQNCRSHDSPIFGAVFHEESWATPIFQR